MAKIFLKTMLQRTFCWPLKKNGLEIENYAKSKPKSVVVLYGYNTVFLAKWFFDTESEIKPIWVPFGKDDYSNGMQELYNFGKIFSDVQDLKEKQNIILVRYLQAGKTINAAIKELLSWIPKMRFDKAPVIHNLVGTIFDLNKLLENISFEPDFTVNWKKLDDSDVITRYVAFDQDIDRDALKNIDVTATNCQIFLQE